MKRILTILCALIMVGFISGRDSRAEVRKISPKQVSGHGNYSNSPDLIIDGKLPKETTSWTGPQCVYWNGIKARFVIDLGRVEQVSGILVQVDNNDDYRVDYSTDGRKYFRLTDIKKGYGEINWGIDTLSSIPGHPEYISQMAFTPVKARFIKFYAAGGDNSYCLSELQVFGESSTPDPVSKGIEAYKKGDYKTAYKTLLPLAKKGNPVAQRYIGAMYRRGRGLQKDYSEAAKWYRKAADQGHVGAQNDLAFMYMRGRGVPKDLKEAMRWYRKAAEQGHAKAQTNLAIAYLRGQGVPKNYSEGLKWCRTAAVQGFASAQNTLGVIYAKGLGVPKNPPEAVKWYRKAASQGQPQAQYNLGRYYYKGLGVPQDYSKALKWYRKAAEQGYVNAQFSLGLRFYNGEGVQKDYVAAYMWWNLAAAQGHKVAAENRDIVAKEMSRAQLAKAQRLAREWKPKKPDSKPVKVASAPRKPAEVSQKPKSSSSVSKNKEIGRDGTFIAYATGVVTDTKTGFEWIAGPDWDTNWNQARAWVKKLSVGGNWRMPTREEVKTLYKKDLGKGNMTSLLKTSGYYVWSGEKKDSTNAWIFDHNQGKELILDHNTPYRARGFAVRSPKGIPGKKGKLKKTSAKAPSAAKSPAPGKSGKPVESAFPRHPFNINVAPYSGSLRIDHMDLSFEGNPLGLSFTREYNGSLMFSGILGPGWTHSLDYRIREGDSGSEVLFFGPENSVTLFRKGQGQRYESESRKAYMVKGEKNRFKMVNEENRFHFSPDGRLRKIDNLYGQALTFTYEKGRLKKVSDPLGEGIGFSYNGKGLLKSAKSTHGDIVEYGYDSDLNLSTVSKNGVLSAEFGYDKNGFLSKAAAGRFTWKIKNSTGGRVAQYTNPFGYTTCYAYKRTPKYKEYTVIDPNGGKTAHRYWLDGSRIVVADATGGKTVSRLNPDTGLLESMTDPNGNITRYRWDERKRLISVRDPIGRRTKIDYVDESQWPERMDTPDGNVMAFKYDPYFNVIELRDRNRGAHTFKYDKMGRLVYEKDVDGTETLFKYAGGWNPVSISVGKQEIIRFTYDEKGKLVSMKSPVSGKQKIKDYEKTLLKLMDRTMPRFDLAQAGKIFSSKDDLTRYVFDKAGNITSVRNPDKSKKTFVYDPQNRIIKEMMSGKTAMALGYDANGNIASMTLADGKTIRCGYDEGNRIETVSYPDGKKARYTYDDADRMTRTEYEGIETTHDYDRKGMLLSNEMVSSGHGGSLRTKLSYEYKESKDRRLRRVNVGNFKLQYLADEKGILKRISSSPFGEFKFDYDPKKGIKRITYPNGIEEQHSYGGPGKKIAIVIKKAGNPILSIDADMGPQGLTRSRTANGRKEIYAYDKRGQIISYVSDTGKAAYQYDAWGNRIQEDVDGKSIKYKYLPGARLLRKGNISYQWDPHGNMMSKKDRQGKTAFSFDHENRLVAVKGGPEKEVFYRYNAQGFMISRTVGEKTTYYLYDGYNPIAELDEKGDLLRAYVHAPGLNAILGMVEFIGKETGAVYYFHRDERNNVVLVTNQKGSRVAAYRYDPFGNVISRTGDFDSPFLFGGYRLEPLYNLYYLVARFYDPDSGRFLSKDPLMGTFEDALSTNPYLYVKNSPLNYLDPMGTSGMPAISGGNPRSSWTNEPTLTVGDAASAGSAFAGQMLTGWMNSSLKDFGNSAYSLTKGITLSLTEYAVKNLNYRQYYSSGHMIEELITGQPGKWARDMSQKVDIMGKSVGYLFSIGSYWRNTNKVMDDFASGKLTEDEAFQQRYFETLNVFGSSAVGTAAGWVSGATLAALGVTGAPAVITGAIATTLVTATTMGAYKYAFLGGPAKEEADKAVKDERAHHRRLVTDKMAQFKEAIKAGDLEKAKRLKKGLKVYANSRQARGEQDILKTSEKHELDFAYFDARHEDFKEKRDQERLERKAYNEELREKSKAYNQQLEKEKEEERKKAEAWEKAQLEKMAGQPLNIKLTLTKQKVKPGDRLIAKLSISGGKTPYRLSGNTSGDSYGSESIDFTAPKAPGQYAIGISAVGAEGRAGSAQAVFEVTGTGNVTQGTFPGTLTGDKGTSGSIRITITGKKVTGSYSGKNTFYEAAFGGSFKDTTYDFRTGVINGRLKGWATYPDVDDKGNAIRKTDQLTGPFRGTAMGNRASGTWKHDGTTIGGTWETNGGRIVSVENYLKKYGK